jgi:hypothetical protein
VRVNSWRRWAIVLALASCSRSADPKACEQRIGQLEQRLATLTPPTNIERWAGGYAVPRVPRDRTQAIGADGIVVMSRYADGAMWMRGFGQLANVRGTPPPGDVVVDVKKVLRDARAASQAPTIPVYVVVPKPEHEMTHLIDMLAGVDPSFDLRLVVGLDEPRTEPAPADAPAAVRDKLVAMPPPVAAEYGMDAQKLIDKGVGNCDGLGRAVIEAIVKDDAPNLAPVLARIRRCGCSTVHVPTIEAVLAALAFNVGRPKLAWLPLDLSIASGSVQQFVGGASPPTPAPEPGLGAPCKSAADCTAPSTACVPFDADGTWYPGRPTRCTRPCGDGCPKGFRCTREVAITGVDQGGIRGQVVSTWCGPIAAR